MSTDISQETTSIANGPFPAVEISRYAVLRAAVWPIETLDPFDQPALVDLAREVGALTAAVAHGRVVVCDALAAVVPRSGRELRRRLLAARRALHRHDGRHPDVPSLARLVELAEPEAARTLRRDDEQREQLDELSRRFAQAHQRALIAEGRSLRRIGSTGRFLGALRIGSPQLAQRWGLLLADEDGVRPQVPPDSTVDRLENAVFGYVCRAVGRAVPSGAWAGVAPVRPGAAGLDVRAVDGRTLIEPNLSAFEEVVVGLAAATSVGAGHPLRVDPKRQQALTGSADPFVRLLLDGFGQEVRTAPSLIDALARAVGDAAGARSRLASALVSLIEAGVVISAAVLPRGAADAWEALADVGPLLGRARQQHWDEALARMRAVCDDMERALAAGRLTEVADAVRSLESVVAELRSAAGVGPWAGPVMRARTRLPFDVAWDEPTRARVGQAVRRVLAYYALEGVAEAYRRASVRDLLALTATGTGTTATAAAAAPSLVEVVGRAPFVVTPSGHDVDAGTWAGAAARPGDPELTRVAARAAERLAPYLRAGAAPVRLPDAFSDSAAATSPGPIGSVRLELGADEVVFRAGRPEPGFASFGPGGWFPQLHGELARWLHDWTEHGREAVEVVGSDPANQNAALGRDLPVRRIGPVPSALDPRSLTVHVADDLRPFLLDHGPGVPTPEPNLLIPLHVHPAAVGRTNPLSAGLWRMAQAQGWEWLGLGSPLHPTETASPHPTSRPRLDLTEGVVLSARRWVLDIARLADIAAYRGAERYLQWSAMADRIGLPRLVFVHLDAHPEAPELLVHTHSALAVRALLDTVVRRLADPVPPPRAVFRELPSDPGRWPIRSALGHHLAELVVTWRDPRFWSGSQRRRRAAPRPVGDDVAWRQAQWSLAARADGTGPDVPWSLIEDAVRALTEAGASHVWYTRKDGVRLRVLGPHAALEPVLARHSTAAARARAIRDWHATDYAPEVDRFGGAAGMRLAHDLFHADTPAALREVQLTPGGALLSDRLSLCIASHVAMARAALGDPSQVREVWRALAVTARTGLGPAAVPPGGLVEDIMRVALDPGTLVAAPLRPLVADAMARAVAVGEELRQLAGLTSDARREWLVGAVLFASNRRDFGLRPAKLAAAFTAAMTLTER